MTSIRLRRDTVTNWAASNPILHDGEPGYDKTNDILKIGDGSSAWDDLPGLSSTAVTVVAGPGIDPTGTADSTVAIQALLTAATANSLSAFGFGTKLQFPAGRFKVSATLLSDLAKGLEVEGAGRYCTYILPTAAMVDTPVFKFQDYYHVTIRDLTIQGGSAGTQPSAAIESHRERPNASAAGQVCQKLHANDVTMVNVQRGIYWTIKDAGSDGNNDQSTITGCFVSPFTVAAYDINGVNPVWIRFIGGEISSGPIAWRLAGGSFTAMGTVIGNLSDTEIDVTAGTYIHPSELIGVSSENDSSGATILRTAAVSNFVIKYTNYERTQSVINKTMIDFQATGNSQFSMVNSFMDLGQTGQLAQFTDSTSIARFIGCPGLALNTISYNGRLYLWGNRHIPGTVTLTNLGSGTLSQFGDSGGGFGSSTTPKIEEFTAVGTTAWTKATGAKTVEVILIPSGGGGASGRRGASGTVCGGGGGGAAGQVSRRTFDAADLTSSVNVVINAGGTAGAAVTTDDTNGNAGGVGGNVAFGAYLAAEGGRGGTGGTTTGGAGGANFVRSTVTAAGAGGIGGTGAASAAADASNVGAGGGGGGGGISAVPAAFNGGAGGGSYQGLAASGGAGGIVDSTLPGTGTAASGKGTPGGSAGGGAASITTAAQAGGTPTNYGAGGAGGGASLNGNASGAGAVGKSGYALIITHFL